MAASEFVNISVVTFNRIAYTRRAIESVLNLTDYPHVLTVVDNGSVDGTQNYLKELQDKGFIKNLVLLERNIGVAKASNIGWSMERNAPFYLKLDNDIEIAKRDWLSKMVRVVENVKELGAVAYNFEGVNYDIGEANGYRIRLKEGTLGGACILIPKRTEEKIGHFNEDFGLYGLEDGDYGMRIIASGLFNAYMEDEDAVFHLPEKSPEYVGFKQRHFEKNVSKYNEVVIEYLEGKRECYIKSSFF